MKEILNKLGIFRCQEEGRNMKKLKQLLVSLLVVSIVLSYWKGSLVFAETETVVGGRITTNTVWTKEHSPYRVTSMIGLADNVTLTIEKGVIVLFNENTGINALFEGKLIVNGTTDEKVVFQFAQTGNDINEEITVGSDSQLKNFEIQHARIGLDLEGQNNKIENGKISNSTLHGIYVSGKYNEILNNGFHSNQNGISFFGNENHIIGNEIQASIIYGIDLGNSTKNIFINNRILNSQGYAVYSDAPYYSLVNYFYHNTFSDNRFGIKTSTSNVFSKNNIYDLVNIMNSDYYTMDLSQNYWGTTVEEEINQKIVLPDPGYISTIKPYLTEGSGPVEKVIPDVPILNPIKDNDELITGKAAPFEKVTIIQKYSDWTRNVEAVADENGNFQTTFTKVPAGEKVEAFVTNEFGMKSPIVSTTVLDGTKPAHPKVEEVNNLSTSIRGTGEIDAKVILKKDGDVIGEAVIGEDGKFEINIPLYMNGIVLTITLIDSSNNSSDPLTIIVKDRVAPEKPTVETVTTSSATINGTSEPGSVVRLYNQFENFIKETTTDLNGRYSMNIDQYSLGTKLILKAFDKENNVSEKTTLTVVFDAPKLDDYSDASTILRGKTEPNATVWVSSNSFFQSVVANDLGEFESALGKQKAGTKITIKVFKNGLTNETSIFVSDKTAPQKPVVVEVTDQTREIIGIAESNSTVTVKANGILLGSDTSDSEQTFNIPIELQKAGNTLEVQATDQAGNVSEVTLITVQDAPPSQPIVNTVTNKSFDVSGKAEVNTTLTVNIAGKYYSAKTDSYGNFKVAIPVQNTGTSLSITAKDEAGNSSAAKTILVKRVAPNMPTVNPVDNKALAVLGKAEVGSIVTVSLAGKYYSAKTDAYGNYRVAIPTPNTGTSLSIIAKDSAGNSSVARTTVVKRVAPNMPTVYTVDNKASYVRGKTEAYATVTMTIGTRSYSGKADRYGNYKISIPIQNSGTSVSITAKDSAGKISVAQKTTVIRVAPNMPTVNTVKYYSTTVSGKTEKYATVIIKVSTRTYTVKANSYGNFKAYIPKQKVGTKIYVTAKDSKAYVSAARTVTVSK